MKKNKTSRQATIQKALDDLNKAIAMEDDYHIQIATPGGFFECPETTEFICAIKTFMQAYKKFYGIKKVKINMAL